MQNENGLRRFFINFCLCGCGYSWGVDRIVGMFFVSRLSLRFVFCHHVVLYNQAVCSFVRGAGVGDLYLVFTSLKSEK